ncbi:hypothetical protein GWO13_10285 [Candidatus Bathyarchaeota archaeon]|nr:hypothetical protein [Candidatus Bathyarchaeota archaeon]
MRKEVLLIPILTLLLLLLSLLYSRAVPAIIGVRVSFHGFPFEWLRIVTYVFPESPMEYEILPDGLALNLLVYFLISCIIVYAILTVKKQPATVSQETNHKKTIHQGPSYALS